MNLESGLIPVNYKGQWCPLQQRTCQEGYCSGCCVALDFFDALEVSLGWVCLNKTLRRDNCRLTTR